jgi:transcriptional regulator with XRE-family HTH domain
VDRMGARLRAIRTEWGLSLREVEEQSGQLAQEWGDQAYQISASWLARLEREDHELTASKLFALAALYNLPHDALLKFCHPRNGAALKNNRLNGPNTTQLLGEGPLENAARYLLPDSFTTDPTPEETTLLPRPAGATPGPYRRAILGRRDRTLDPMIRAGSILQIHTQQRAIAARRSWTHEFDRPIYLLLTRDGYVCGWSELDKDSAWLTLIPHPLSHATSQRWRYKKEVEIVGRVVAVSMRLVEEALGQ